MAPRLQLTVFLLHWFVVMVLVCLQVRTQTVSFVIQPQDETIVEGSRVAFTCEISTTAPVEAIKWYFRSERGSSHEIESDGDRFEISGAAGQAARSLVISDSETNDSGFYFCTYGNQSKSTLGRLDVLPTSWLPKCSRTPSTGTISIGETFALTCASTGHVNTSLVWYVQEPSGSSPVNNAQVNVSKESTKVTSIYGDTIDISEAMMYTCEATLEGLLSIKRCTISINDEPQFDVIPYIVVGLMSLIALLLFFVVLLILFRHRQCRLCQQAMQEPHTVLDAQSLQTGSWVPPPVVAIDVEGSESSEDRVSEKDTDAHVQHTYIERGTTQPPDVVPVLEPVEVPEIGDQPSSSTEVVPKTAPAAAVNDQPNKDQSSSSELVPKTAAASTIERKPKTKNLTLTKNMDKNIEKPEKSVEKKEVQFPAHKTRGTHRKDKKVKHAYKEPPVKAKMKSPHQKEPIYAHVKKLNVPLKSAQGETEGAPSTSARATTDNAVAPPPDPPPRPSPDTDSKDTSSTATTADTNSLDQTPVGNDLGRGNSKKKRVKHYRKKSEDIKRNSNPPGDVVLNIPANTSAPSSSSAEPISSPKVPADRVIYAELDFSKNVGLNIID